MKTWKKISALLLSFGMLLSLLAVAPVSAAAPNPTKGSITIHKYIVETKSAYNQLKEQGDRSGGNQIDFSQYDDLKDLKPMKDVQFNLIKVEDDGTKELTPDTAVPDTSFAERQISTNENGEIVFDNLPLGTYKLTELKDPRVQAAMEPVLISVPTYNQAHKTDPDKYPEEFLYNIHVYPKNLIDQEGPDIEKDVVQEKNNDATVDLYEPFNWIILSDIPSEVSEDVQAAKKYVITDKLDHRLDFVKNVSVKLRSTEGSELELAENEDYTFKADKVNEGSYKPDNQSSLTWELTEIGLGKLKNYAGGKVVTTFSTKLNEKAEVATAIPNQAKLEYVNWNDYKYLPKSDIPEVHTGGIKIKKVDKANHTTLLEGAKFMIYRSEEAAKEGNPENAIQRNGKAYEVPSDAKGIAYFEGLAYGDEDNMGQTVEQGATDYWIVETEAPTLDGVKYNRLKDPFKVTVNSTSHNETRDMYVVYNAKDNYELPFTGGTGLLVFLGGGAALLAAAYLISKSGKNKTAK